VLIDTEISAEINIELNGDQETALALGVWNAARKVKGRDGLTKRNHTFPSCLEVMNAEIVD
jgi:hypothetical protein